MDCWLEGITFPTGVELNEAPTGDLAFARAIVPDRRPGLDISGFPAFLPVDC